MRLKGKLINWNKEKAFGFINPNGGGEHVFIHKSAFNNRQRKPQMNDVIIFSITKDKHGRYCASEATFSGEKSSKHQVNSSIKFSIYLSVMFLGFIISAFFIDYIPINLALTYFGVSTLTFIVYAIDKSKARRNAWRTSESTLHFLALAGGWPGAAIAQQNLRHKSQKKKFRVMFWLTVLVNCGALAWLMSSNGQPYMALFS
ncbi:cold shock and DUF1294 domain-containing protein [Thalassotalea atypica]|uniref:cold shock and DUF1294 domain-containing protein n=1 Tax=Thalassotalea atypica TaxID=2054316 RepID=UPI002573C80D|nr:cold shock and DUF1294 domain-containing protein [Thalassotalea atypica]